jgi:hypothetical protein
MASHSEIGTNQMSPSPVLLDPSLFVNPKVIPPRVDNFYSLPYGSVCVRPNLEYTDQHVLANLRFFTQEEKARYKHKTVTGQITTDEQNIPLHEKGIKPAIKLDKDEIREIQNAKKASKRYFPDFMQNGFAQIQSHIQNILMESALELHRKRPSEFLQLSIDNKKRNIWTAKFVERLFPQIALLPEDRQKKYFEEKTLVDYINEDAIKTAKGFVQWCCDFMPPKIRNSLEFRNAVSNANYLHELIRMVRSPKKGEVYPQAAGDTQYQAIVMLNLVYLAVLSKIMTHPEEAVVLNEFDTTVANAFPVVHDMTLGVCIGSDKKVNKVGLHTGVNVGATYKKGDWKPGYQYSQQYKGCYVPEIDEYVLYLKRRKEEYARMLKILRGRFPLSDPLGARWVLKDKKQLKKFETSLRKKLKGWTIKREGPEEDSEGESVTVSPQSNWKEGQKYTITWNQMPEVKFEGAVYWILEYGKAGNFASNIFGYDENFLRYRMDELRESIMPIMFPEELSLVKWDGEDSINQMHNHAYDTTLQSALNDFEGTK